MSMRVHDLRQLVAGGVVSLTCESTSCEARLLLLARGEADRDAGGSGSTGEDPPRVRTPAFLRGGSGRLARAVPFILRGEGYDRG